MHKNIYDKNVSRNDKLSHVLFSSNGKNTAKKDNQ